MEINETMTAMQVRLALKDKGWDSKDVLSKRGWLNKYGYSIWFERWDWHDVKIGPVCIHSHTDNLNETNKMVYNTAVKALKAWDDFTDSVPCQIADGSLKEDTLQTDFFRKSKTKGKSDNTEFIKLYDDLLERKRGYNS